MILLVAIAQMGFSYHKSRVERKTAERHLEKVAESLDQSEARIRGLFREADVSRRELLRDLTALQDEADRQMGDTENNESEQNHTA